jgi:hypothetical protein
MKTFLILAALAAMAMVSTVEGTAMYYGYGGSYYAQPGGYYGGYGNYGGYGGYYYAPTTYASVYYGSSSWGFNAGYYNGPAYYSAPAYYTYYPAAYQYPVYHCVSSCYWSAGYQYCGCY